MLEDYKYFKLTIYSHFFKISHIDYRYTKVLLRFISGYVQMGWIKNGNRNIYAPLKVFGASDRARTEYRLHINALPDFMEFLIKENIELDKIYQERVPLYEPAKINIQMKKGWEPRDYQVPMVEYFTKDDHNSKFLDLQTGKGKSFIATQAIINKGLRTIIIVRPLFMEKWGQDLVKMLDISPKQILMVRGNSQFTSLIEMANSDEFDYPFIILSNKTFQFYISNYERDPKDSYEHYGIYLEDLYKHLKIGIKLVDEIHLDFHLNFKIEMYTHIPHTFGLSATLFHDDPFLDKMYKIMYPLEFRYNTKELDKYIDSYAMLYNQDYSAKLRTSEFGSKTYSHIAYEKSIIKNPRFRGQYLKMIKYCVDVGFMEDYKPKEKIVIFVGSIKFATLLTDYLKLAYPNLDVRRYVEDDPYENLMDPDIRVTTLLSGGTGHDIPNLKMVLLTVAIRSSQSNVQSLGRLRKLDNTPTRFYYLTNLNIKKHVMYHESKKEMLKYRCKSYKEFLYPELMFTNPKYRNN